MCVNAIEDYSAGWILHGHKGGTPVVEELWYVMGSLAATIATRTYAIGVVKASFVFS